MQIRSESFDVAAFKLAIAAVPDLPSKERYYHVYWADRFLTWCQRTNATAGTEESLLAWLDDAVSPSPDSFQQFLRRKAEQSVRLYQQFAAAARPDAARTRGSLGQMVAPGPDRAPVCAPVQPEPADQAGRPQLPAPAGGQRSSPPPMRHAPPPDEQRPRVAFVSGTAATPPAVPHTVGARTPAAGPPHSPPAGGLAASPAARTAAKPSAGPARTDSRFQVRVENGLAARQPLPRNQGAANGTEPWKQTPGTKDAAPTRAGRPAGAAEIPEAPVATAQTWEQVWDLFAEHAARKCYSYRTLQCYRGWIRRFAAFLDGRRPSEVADKHARAFLSHLAVERKVGAKTQNQALHALVFLFRRLLGRPIDHLQGVERAPERRRLPQVLGREQVRQLLEHMRGLSALMARLCYGCGLRLEECLSLRIKDIALDRRQLTVRQGKGDKDRVVPLPRSLAEPLRAQIADVQALHQRDLATGLGAVELPGALAAKLPGAAHDFAWQWLFPAQRVILFPDGLVRRPHRHPSTLQRALRDAVQHAGLPERVTVHSLRHSYATHLLEDGVNIRRLQELLGHSSIATTMIYTHVRVQPLEASDFSPLDRL